MLASHGRATRFSLYSRAAPWLQAGGNPPPVLRRLDEDVLQAGVVGGVEHGARHGNRIRRDEEHVGVVQVYTVCFILLFLGNLIDCKPLCFFVLARCVQVVAPCNKKALTCILFKLKRMCWQCKMNI